MLRAEKQDEMGKHKGSRAGFTVWFTGLSGTGKTTSSRLLKERLLAYGYRVELLDGDIVRQRLSRGLTFSKEDRDENIRRIGYVCELLGRNGVVSLVAAISPYRAAREWVRMQIPHFVEVYMECPLTVLIEKDVRGLYRRALAGKIPNFTGISDPYEPPLDPDVRIRSYQDTPTDGVDRIWEKLEKLRLVD
jgi:adenylyl-sulfate kinase